MGEFEVLDDKNDLKLLWESFVIEKARWSGAAVFELFCTC